MTFNMLLYAFNWGRNKSEFGFLRNAFRLRLRLFPSRPCHDALSFTRNSLRFFVSPRTIIKRTAESSNFFASWYKEMFYESINMMKSSWRFTGFCVGEEISSVILQPLPTGGESCTFRDVRKLRVFKAFDPISWWMDNRCSFWVFMWCLNGLQRDCWHDHSQQSC